MAESYKSLGQSAPGAATLTAIYTVPASTSAVVSSIVVCNRSATPTTFRLAVSPAGAAIADAHYIAYDVAIAANEVVALALGITLATTDVVRVYATLATISFNLFGTEIV